MPKMLFRGAIVRFVDARYDEKSKMRYARINLTSDYSDPVREAMEWGETPEGFTSAKLTGEITATHLILTPNGRELKQYEVQLSAKELGGFGLFRVKNQDGEGTHLELRFQIVSADPDAGPKLWEYVGQIGRGVAQLRVNFEAQSEMDLEGKGESEDVDAERLISPEQAAETAEDGPALASASDMGHKRGARNKTRSLEPIQ